MGAFIAGSFYSFDGVRRRNASRLTTCGAASGCLGFRFRNLGFGLGLLLLSGLRHRGRVEPQSEAHIRISEAGHRAERNDQRRRHATERQADAEQSGLGVHLEVPELVLQDDRHLLRILRAQPRRDHDARMIGAERDVEMVLAGQAVRRGVRQCQHQHLAHRRLGPLVVREQAFRPLFRIIFHQRPRTSAAPIARGGRWGKGSRRHALYTAAERPNATPTKSRHRSNGRDGRQRDTALAANAVDDGRGPVRDEYRIQHPQPHHAAVPAGTRRVLAGRGGHLGRRAGLDHLVRGDLHRPALGQSGRSLRTKADGAAIDAGDCDLHVADGPGAEPVAHGGNSCRHGRAGRVQFRRNTAGVHAGAGKSAGFVAAKLSR